MITPDFADLDVRVAVHRLALNNLRLYRHLRDETNRVLRESITQLARAQRYHETVTRAPDLARKLDREVEPELVEV